MTYTNTLPPYLAEHDDRPAKVVYSHGWAGPLGPWPFCSRVNEPHDSHIDNEGNVRCPGKEGIILATSVEVQEELLTNARRREELAKKALADALRKVANAERNVERAEELWLFAQARNINR